MGEVIQFKSKEPEEESTPMYWQCNCGCQLFYITLDGYECSDCEKTVDKPK